MMPFRNLLWNFPNKIALNFRGQKAKKKKKKWKNSDFALTFKIYTTLK